MINPAVMDAGVHDAIVELASNNILPRTGASAAERLEMELQAGSTEGRLGQLSPPEALFMERDDLAPAYFAALKKICSLGGIYQVDDHKEIHSSIIGFVSSMIVYLRRDSLTNMIAILQDPPPCCQHIALACGSGRSTNSSRRAY